VGLSYLSSNLVIYAVIGAKIISYKIEWFSICHDTSEDNDTSNRLGCHRKKIVGETPMSSNITSHSHWDQLRVTCY